jgi:hypothetical protein
MCCGSIEEAIGRLFEDLVNYDQSLFFSVGRSVSSGAQIKIVLREEEGRTWKRMAGFEDRMSGSGRRCGRDREFAREWKVEVGRKVGR